MKKTVWTVLMALVATLCLHGCNTMEGIGKDLESAGDSIENAAKKNK